MSRVPGPRAPLFEALEERKLLSADAGLPTLDFAFAPAAAEIRSLDVAAPAMELTSAPAQARHELALVDGATPDLARVLQALHAERGAGRAIDVVVIDTHADGIVQVSAALASRSNLDAVHLVSHGEPGAIKLGTTTLDLATLEGRGGEIRAWSHALAQAADLLVYGCDVAATPAGAAWVQRLHDLTGADVAASTDATGSADLGGDWVLEDRVGLVHTPLALDAAVLGGWHALLATQALDWNVQPAGPIPETGPGTNTYAATYGIGPGTVTLTVQDPFDKLRAEGTPRVNNLLTGGISSASRSLQLNAQAGFAAGESAVVTLTFAGYPGGVSNVRLTLFDIDTATDGTGFVDQVVVSANGGALNPSSVVVGPAAAVAAGEPTPGTDGTSEPFARFDGSNTITGRYSLNSPIPGFPNGEANATNGSSNGDAYVVFAQSGISSISFIYRSARGASAQGIALYNVLFDVKDVVARNDAATTAKNAAVSVGASTGVLANDVDNFPGAGESLAVAAVMGTAVAAGPLGTTVTLPSGARVTMRGDGGYVYDPNGAFDALAPGATATDTFQYTLSDQATPTAHTDVGTVTITITSPDLPPVLGGLGTLLYSEKDPATPIAPGATLIDPDATGYAGGTLTVAFTANGAAEDQLGIRNVGTAPGQIGVSGTTVTFGGVAVGSVSGGANGTPLAVALNGAANPAAVQALLRAVTYANGSSSPSTLNRTLAFTLNDGAGASGSATATVSVSAVNDPPTNTVPGAQTTAMNAPIVFSGPRLVSVGDVDANGGVERVALAVGNGTLTLGSLAGLASVSGNGTASLVFTGSLASLNSALNGLTYTPALDYSGADALSVTTNDQGNTGTGGALTATSTIAITVQPNQPPTLAAVGLNPTFTEAPGLATQAAPVTVFSGASAGTVEAGQSIVALDVTVAGLPDGANERIVIDGTSIGLGAASSGTTVTNAMAYSVTLAASTATVTLTKAAGVPPANLNALVNGIAYANTSTDNPTPGARIFTLTRIRDSGGAANGGQDTTALAIASTVNVVAVNDPPALANAGTLAYTENQAPAPISAAITVGDPDSATLASATVAITGNFAAGEDVLGFTGVPATMGNIAGSYNAATGALTLTSAGASATPAQWQAALRAVTYANNSDAPSTAVRTVSFTVNDAAASSNTVAGAVTVAAVNDAPTLAVPAGFAATEQTPLALTAMAVGDVDGSGGAETLTLAVASGTLSAVSGTTGVVIAGSGTATLTLTGTITQLSDLLTGSLGASLTYFNGSDAPPPTDTLTVTLNDNGNTGAGPAQSVARTSTITITAVNDPPTVNAAAASGAEDAPSIAVTLAGADVDGSVASFLLAGLPANGTLYADATLTTPAVAGGSYAASGNARTLWFVPAANWNGTASFQFRAVDDQGATSAAAATAMITVMPVNDPPAAGNDTYATSEDTPLVVTAPGVLANDADVDSATITAVLAAPPANGTVVLNADGSFTYTPNANFFGADSFTYRAFDGSLFSGFATVGIDVAWVNDAPVASGGATLASVAEDAPALPAATVAALFGGNYSDATDGALQTPLAGVAIVGNAATAAQGRWQYAAAPGGPWSDVPAAGLGDANALTLPAAYLLRFVPAPDANGVPGALSVRLADGSGAAISAASGVDLGGAIGGSGRWSAGTVALATSVWEVNDPPVRIAGGFSPLTVLEDSGLTPLGLGALAYAPGPVNEASQSLGYTITQVPPPTLGNVVLADGTTVVTAGTSYTLAELQGLQLLTAPDAHGSAAFSFVVADNGTTQGATDPRSIAESLAITVTAVNDPPTLAMPGAAPSYVEDALPIAVDAGALVDDVEANWNGGTLAARITANAEAADRLSIVAGSGVTLSGNTVFVGGTSVGTASAVAVGGGASLVITFNAAASNAGVAAVARAIAYDSASQSPGTAARTVTFTVTDDAGASATATRSVNVVAVNDDPYNAAGLPARATTLEDVPGAIDLSAISLADVDAGSGALTLRLVVGAGSLLATSGGGVTVAGSGGTTLTATGDIAALSAFLANANAIRYLAPADANGAGLTTLALAVSDNGHDGVGGGAFVPLGTVPIDVTAVNDAPSFTLAGNVTVNEDAPPQTLPGFAAGSPGPADESTQTLTYSLAIDNPALFSVAPAIAPDGTLTFTLAPDANGVANVSVVLRDSGGTANGGIDAAPVQVLRLTVSSVNDPPVVGGTAPVTYTENAPALALAGTITDIDSPSFGGGSLAVAFVGGGRAEDTLAIADQGNGAGQIGVSGTTVSYGGTPIGTWSGGGAGSDLVVSFNANATPSAAQALMRAVTYVNGSDDPSTAPRTVRITVVDGAGGANTGTADVALGIVAVNDLPSIQAPSPQTTAEDGVLGFATAMGNAIVVGDPDATVLQVTLAAPNALLTLSGTAGLVFTTGTGTSDTSMTFTGSIGAINTALDGLVLAPFADYHGATLLTIAAGDLGATGIGGPRSTTAGVPVAVTPVADTPSVTNAATLEDTQTASGLVVTRNAADGAEVTHFKITAIIGGLLFLADGTTPVTDGTFVTAAQGAAGLRFTPAPDAIAPGSFAVQASTSASDPGLGGGLAIASIAVTPVNDAPQLAIGPGQIVAEDSGPHVVPAFASASPGGGPDEASQAIGYVVANDNAALFAAAPALDAAGNLIFTSAPNAFGSATVTVRARDSGGTANGGQDTSAPRTFTITVTAVNDDPVAAADAATTDEDTPRSFPAVPGLLANDTDVDPGTSLVVHAVNGLTAAVGTPIVLASGARVQVNADGSWSYDPHGAFEYLAVGQTAADGFNYTVSDGAGGFSTAAVAVTVTGVNDAPVATADALITNEDTVITAVAPGVLGNDSDVDAGTTLVVAAVNGATTAVGNTVTLATGALLQVNADGRWRYDPNRAFESLGTGQSVIDSFTYSVTDGAGGSATTTVTVTVQGVNDPPVNALPASPTVPEDTRVAIPGLSVSDPEGNVTRVTLSVAQGTLDVSLAGGATIGANGSATLSIDGTLGQVNAALASLAYRPATNYTGTDALAITSFDADGASTASALAIAVAAVDDPPTLSAPAMRMTQEDVTLHFSAANGNPIVVADVDSPVLTVTLAASRGLLTLSTTAGLTFATGSGTNDATIVFSGSAAAINAALDGLAFAPEPQFGGAAALAVSVSDGASAASAAVPIAVVPVADAPRLAAAPAIGDEDTRFPLALSAALVDRDGSEMLSVAIDDIPVGVTLADGVRSFTAAAGARRLDATGWNLAALTLAPPQDSFGAFTLAVLATSREAANGASATVSAALPVTVRPVNDAPVASGDAVLPAVVEDAPAPPGASAAALFAARYDDSRDASLATPLAGIAIVANAATAEQGVWQYSLDGTTWKAVSSAGLGDANALTLPAGAMLRFLAAADWNGAPGALTVRLADGSRGAIGEQANVDLRGGIGGTGAWSAASVMLRTAVSPENDAPVLVHRELTVAEGATRVIAPDALLATDADHAADQIFFTLRSLPAHGVLLFDGGTVDAGFRFTQADVAAGRLAYRHDGSETRSDAFAFDVADAAGAGLSGRTLAIDVTPVDDPPVIVAASIRGNGGEAGALQTVLRAADADTPASQLVFTVTDVRDGRFERIDRPGVAIVQFTQAEIDAGTVRFVSTNAFGVPSFTVWVSDDTSAVGPRTAAVTFAPALAWVSQRPVVEEPLPDVVSTAGPPPLGPYAGLVDPTIVAYLRPPSAPAPVGTMSVASADAVSRAAMRGAQKATPGDALADETRIAALPDAAIAFADPETIAIDHGKLSVDVISTRGVDLAGSGESWDLKLDSVRLTGMVFSVGFVWWALRASGLLASLLAAAPAWRHLDPLPVLGGDARRKGVEWVGARDAEAEREEEAVAPMLAAPEDDRA